MTGRDVHFFSVHWNNVYRTEGEWETEASKKIVSDDTWEGKRAIEKDREDGWEQCDQIVRFLKVFGYKLSNKSGPNIGQFSRLLWKALFFKWKLLCLLFGHCYENLGYFYSNLWSHCCMGRTWDGKEKPKRKRLNILKWSRQKNRKK